MTTSAVDDTRREAARVLSALYGRMTPAEKLSRVRMLTNAANRLAFAGLRKRHPDESDGQLLRRLTLLRMGVADSNAAYGDLTGRGA